MTGVRHLFHLKAIPHRERIIIPIAELRFRMPIGVTVMPCHIFASPAKSRDAMQERYRGALIEGLAAQWGDWRLMRDMSADDWERLPLLPKQGRIALPSDD